jgi:hypothetical protein
MKNNNFILRLQILWLSPILPSILTFILFTIYKIYFDPVLLCDEPDAPLTLKQLKESLLVAENNSRAIAISIQEFMAIVEEHRQSQTLTSDISIYNARHGQWLKDSFINSLNKSISIENSIREKEPFYLSPRHNSTIAALARLQRNR